MTTGARTFERLWIAHSFVRELILIYPFYAILMGEVGITPFQLSVLLASWSLSVMVFEIPSGTLGDRFSRRTILLVSGWIKAGCFLAWLLWPTFSGFLLGFFLWGLGGSLRSGTAEAWIHDQLAATDALEHYERVLGRGRAGEHTAGVLAFFGGGLAATSGFEIPLIVSIASPVVASLLLLSIREVERSVPVDEPSPVGYLALLRSGLQEVLSHSRLLWIFGLASTAGIVAGVMDEYIGPLLAEDGSLSRIAIGVGFGCVVVGSLVGGLLAHRIPLTRIRSLAALLFVSAAALLAATTVHLVVGVAFLVVHAALSEVATVRLKGQVQSEIRGPARATATSVGGFAEEIAGIALFLVAGAAAHTYGFSGAAVVLAAIGMVFSSFVLVARRREA